jgi:hypothetical protein
VSTSTSTSLLSPLSNNTDYSSNINSSSTSSGDSLQVGEGDDPFLSLLRLYLDAHTQHLQANSASAWAAARLASVKAAIDCWPPADARHCFRVNWL